MVILGECGANGRWRVGKALGQGYDVTAFARNPAGVTTEHVRLSIVRGDVFQKASVQEAVANQDAVLCTIGGHDRLRVAFSVQPRAPGLCSIFPTDILYPLNRLRRSPLTSLP